MLLRVYSNRFLRNHTGIRFRMYFLHAENFSFSTKSNLMHIALRSEDDLRQLSNCSQWFLFLKETKWLSVLENHDNQPQ